MSKTRLIGCALAATALAGCAVGPNYKRPSAPTPQAYKTAEGWTPGEPADGLDKGAWWSVYQDPVLDGLERKVVLNNQNVIAAEAAYRQAAALVDEDRASLWPTLSASLGQTRTGGSQLLQQGTTVNTPAENRYSASLSAAWSLDIWGKTRRLIEEAQAQSEAAKATYANAILSAQATLAIDYFTLRSLDEQDRLLKETVANYAKALKLTQNQYKSGVAARADVLSAESQLETTQASLVDLGVQRGQLEHAIAVLIGVTPDQLSLPSGPFATSAPVTPTGVPSTLLQRRPDIANAERGVAAANAAIGVAVAAYFPTVSLSASDTVNTLLQSALFSTKAATWSFGASASDTLFDFGLRDATVRAAKANHDNAVATYRGTVLAAFQGVEDQLVALRVLESEQGLRERAETAAKRAEEITINQYRAGQVAYSNVITAQNTTLTDRISTLAVRKSRLLASATLIQNLGGGWTVDDLKAAKK